MVQRENAKVTVSLLNSKVNQGLRLLNTAERLSKTNLKSIHLTVAGLRSRLRDRSFLFAIFSKSAERTQKLRHVFDL